MIFILKFSTLAILCRGVHGGTGQADARDGGESNEGSLRLLHWLAQPAEVKGRRCLQGAMDRAAAGVTVDLHGLSVLEARTRVLSTLQGSAPRAVVRFISGVGRHSVGGVSAIKGDLSRCFDAWNLRWRWEHGLSLV
eukprot:COSAG03_NODE_3106_length_2214_cov_1.462411_2_plen_136_part_01